MFFCCETRDANEVVHFLDTDERAECQVFPAEAHRRLSGKKQSRDFVLRGSARVADAPATVRKGKGVRFDNSHCSPADVALKEFVLSVNRIGTKKLGMRVDYEDEIALRVVDVKSDTLISSWNEAHPTMRVEKGDCVLAVNDCYGSTSDMLEELGSASSISLSISKDYWKAHCIKQHNKKQDVKAKLTRKD